MTPSEQHKRNELDNCIRKYNESGDMNAFKRANELRVELGMEQVSQPETLGVEVIVGKNGKIASIRHTKKSKRQ